MTDQGFSLAGRVAIVTGAARGIGAAVARELTEAGARVVLGDVLEEALVETAREIGGAALAVRLDVTDAGLWAVVVEKTLQHFGRIDVLVNNAAVINYARFENTSADSLRRILEVNVVGAFLGMQAVVPAMKRVGGGSIINVSSTAGLLGLNTLSAYSTSKWALRGLSRTVALELGEHAIRVNTLHPAAVDTAMTNPRGEPLADSGKRSAALPLRRLGRAQEVARAIVYLASDAATFTTGSELLVDGGMCAGRYIADRSGST